MPQSTLTLAGIDVELTSYSLELKRSQHTNDGRPVSIIKGCDVKVEAEAQHALGNFTNALRAPDSAEEISVDGTIIVEDTRGTGNIEKQIDFRGGHLINLQEHFVEDGVNGGTALVTAIFAVEELDIDSTNVLSVVFFPNG